MVFPQKYNEVQLQIEPEKLIEIYFKPILALFLTCGFKALTKFLLRRSKKFLN